MLCAENLQPDPVLVRKIRRIQQTRQREDSDVDHSDAEGTTTVIPSSPAVGTNRVKMESSALPRGSRVPVRGDETEEEEDE